MKTEIHVLPQIIFDGYMEDNVINDENIHKHKNFFAISIVGGDNDFEHWFKKDHYNILNLEFDDVDEYIENPEKYVIFNEEHANKILDFLETIKQENFLLAIHCAAGVSRSGAVGTFACDFFGFDYRKFKKKNPNIHPNPTVLKYLNREYRKRLSN